MSKIEFYVQEFNEKNWQRFSSCFKEQEDIDSEFRKIPTDIFKTIVGLLGEESGKNWCKRNLNQLDSKTVFELVDSEQGIKALKAFLLRMPN